MSSYMPPANTVIPDDLTKMKREMRSIIAQWIPQERLAKLPQPILRSILIDWGFASELQQIEADSQLEDWIAYESRGGKYKPAFVQMSGHTPYYMALNRNGVCVQAAQHRADLDEILERRPDLRVVSTREVTDLDGYELLQVARIIARRIDQSYRIQKNGGQDSLIKDRINKPKQAKVKDTTDPEVKLAHMFGMTFNDDGFLVDHEQAFTPDELLSAQLWLDAEQRKSEPKTLEDMSEQQRRVLTNITTSVSGRDLNGDDPTGKKLQPIERFWHDLFKSAGVRRDEMPPPLPQTSQVQSQVTLVPVTPDVLQKRASYAVTRNPDAPIRTAPWAKRLAVTQYDPTMYRKSQWQADDLEWLIRESTTKSRRITNTVKMLKRKEQ